ncbi:cytochrome ubiquinol oxidase subunit I [Acidomonas methanolica]|uniref:Cytochrome bd ubiquinol oxidase subunit I n=1 Tax=Acidomonas methanolica NBRC 104435 TaxID=1231351 RepID=A0A023D2D6_ACIMT|nr:cytochrome ubiquinol oxidase subunit I [Acidomonas methanolica]MBU2653535.1 cytochrome ubiquinol oxidase subunit I [Acidomonas methanolica]TCS31485.1 cytochrome d ubiquinol oxidase subunit I [Acidomonas methanolica]GAJ28292.1 cytochrome bd ubiquinol oxidase subunit I [Acidomonas methanolica NBRC 104435]GBQ55379.1 cytochrome bd ubiquinol oxidase subunit I [Acidomonas methanolica]GEK97905.1 cytochrome d ubiquinol oxidase subunit I [Acidomonas methanolica NBRC 104435]
MEPISSEVVDLSRLQFAVTALYHFMFVPLTLGLTFMLAAMETVYVVTGRKIYKDMAQFWGKLFGINFALGVATGITMEFEFGTNWSMYSRFFGDMFGTPLAIEGLMAFFMESTFVGLMFFGWDRLSKPAHLAVTYLVALGSNLSALWILVANASMNVPQGTHFDPETMRMQFDSIVQVIFNPDAQAKFVHTSVAGYVCASMLVMGISAFYILRGRHKAFAARSFRMAALFGIISTVAVITLGDVLGRLVYEHQPTKLAAMEGVWRTTKPPYEPWLAFAIPDDAKQENDLEIGIPFVLTPLVTHSFTAPITGMKELEDQAGPRISSGIAALTALKAWRASGSASDLAAFNAHKADMGYGFLAARHAPGQDVTAIPAGQLDTVVNETKPDILPNVFVTFWAFRIMVFLSLWFFAVFAFGSYVSLKNRLERNPLLLKLCLWSIPLPILATEFGWITAEAGRQPWTVFDLLPTYLSASTHSVGYMLFSLAGFALIYSIFIAAELYLMFKFARLGPEEHGAHARHDDPGHEDGLVVALGE